MKTHTSYVKIVLLSSKNVNHTSQHRGHFCLGGLFPQQAEQFTGEFKMSAWTGCRQRSSNRPPPAWPAAREGRMSWPSSPVPPDLLHPKSAAPGQVTVSQPTSSRICPWYGWHPVRQMSQWREINLSTRRCQAGDSCGLHFQQMSAVAKAQWTRAGHLLDALYMHGKYFLNKLIRDQNLFVAPDMAAAFRSLIYNIWGHALKIYSL